MFTSGSLGRAFLRSLICALLRLGSMIWECARGGTTNPTGIRQLKRDEFLRRPLSDRDQKTVMFH